VFANPLTGENQKSFLVTGKLCKRDGHRPRIVDAAPETTTAPISSWIYLDAAPFAARDLDVLDEHLEATGSMCPQELRML